MIDVGLIGFGFWMAVAIIVVALVWAAVRKQQMKHDLTLKLLEKGQGMDPELLNRVLASENARLPVQQKSFAEQSRDGGYFVGFLFLVAGLGIALGGALRDPEPSWLQIGLGAFSFAFGYWCWLGTEREYRRVKAEEKLPRN